MQSQRTFSHGTSHTHYPAPIIIIQRPGRGGMGAGGEEGRLHKKIERVVAANLHS